MGLYKEGKMCGRDLFHSLIYPFPPLCFIFSIRKVSTRPLTTRPHKARLKAFGLAGRPVGSTVNREGHQEVVS
jgi:hypothetical protein